MEQRLEEQFGSDGHEQFEPESQEQLEGVYKKLEDLNKQQPFTLTKQELGLLHKLITAPDKLSDSQFWLICDFMDDDEALDHVAAYHEAHDLGLDTTPNIDFVFALCATNRKGNKSNRAAMLMDVLHNFKMTTNYTKGKHDQSANSRSPLN